MSSPTIAANPSFPAVPASWFYLGSLDRLRRGPIPFSLPGGQRFVGFQTASGSISVLSGKCSHMGADLAKGCVVGERLACPLHGWEYGGDGICEKIPITATIPPFARQKSFPVVNLNGHIFVFNKPNASFPMPFFEGLSPKELFAARPFEFEVGVPWFLVGANGFDVQHFRCAHDRKLIGEPKYDKPNEFARRLTANFSVSGSSFSDQITRLFSGPSVEMQVTNWGGNLILVTAKFRRTTSYGMVSLIPLSENRTLLRDIVWVPRRRGSVGRTLLDPLDAEIRRFFIREFVRSDVDRAEGIGYNPTRMIEEDKILVGLLDWLQTLPQ